MKKKYIVTRKWYIEIDESKDVLLEANGRPCDKVEVECLENQFSGGDGLGGTDLESRLLDLLERARGKRSKVYPYLVHESLHDESMIRHFYRESDLINDLISILKEIQ